MKRSKTMFIVLGIVAALIIGFIVGISVEYPRINLSTVTGTIGKVNNYRNTKATEADIELKNNLLADTVMLKSVRNFMNFYYVRSVEFGKNIDFAVTESNTNEAFKAASGKEIAALEGYGKFLNAARKNLLIASAACLSVEKTDPALLRSSIAQANNTVVQMNYRNSVVLNFISGLDAFIQGKGENTYPGLNKAHDLLIYNELGSSMILKDKVVLKFFEKKKLYSKDVKSEAGISMRENIQQDMEQLKAHDSEQLGFLDSEQLGNFATSFVGDIEKLGMIVPFDAERLGTLLDAEKLEYVVPDAEKLGYVVPDTEKLGRVADSEQLKQALLYDSEQLGSWDTEKLARILDSEKLGVFR